MAQFTTLIGAAELQTALANRAAVPPAAEPLAEPLVVLDCRAQLGQPEAGPAAWAAGHIPGAQHANLDLDLAAPAHSLATGPDGGTGGRHPLPDRARFAQRCAEWGISNGAQVVAYDDAGGAYAARAWWLLRWLGHERVAVLDGGLPAWEALPDTQLSSSALPIDDAPSDAEFVPGEPLTRIISLAEVEAVVAGNQSAMLIDARAQQRFDGEMEPIDPVAGHIPGAVCLPHSGNLGPDGLFLAPTALAARFAPRTEAQTELACYCGSGVTAAHNVLAIRHAGLAEPRLYVGSWSEWCAHPDRPRA